MTNYQIDIVSDTVCPWCYVGKNRLDLAIKKHLSSHPEDTFSTTWHPFYLNPKAGAAIDKQAFYESKFGEARTAVMQSHLAKLGSAVGIKFAFGGKTGNTRESHRLVQLGKTKGAAMQTKVVESLFKAYFEENDDITDREVLIAKGVRAGLDEKETRAWMEGGKGGSEVDSEVEEAYNNLVSGVPSFTIAGKYRIQGAEEPEAFLEVFDEIKSSGGQSGAVSSGQNVC